MSITNQPLSDVAVMNMAVTTLDESVLLAPNDETTLGRFMARNYSFARNELLRRYPWNFAKRRAVLAPNADAPAFGFKYAYRAPNDCLRVLPLRHRGALNGDLVPYEYESREILTDAGPSLPIRYVRAVTNAAEFDPLYARALGQLLALMASQRVTGKASYFEKARGLYEQALFDAFSVDSLESGTPEQQYGDDVLNVRQTY